MLAQAKRNGRRRRIWRRSGFSVSGEWVLKNCTWWIVLLTEIGKWVYNPLLHGISLRIEPLVELFLQSRRNFLAITRRMSLVLQSDLFHSPFFEGAQIAVHFAASAGPLFAPHGVGSNRIENWIAQKKWVNHNIPCFLMAMTSPFSTYSNILSSWGQEEAYIYIYIHTYIHTYTHTHTRRHTHTHTRRHTHTQTHTHTHTQTPTHTHTHTNIRPRTLKWSLCRLFCSISALSL